MCKYYIVKREDITKRGHLHYDDEHPLLTWEEFVVGCKDIDVGDFTSEFGFIESPRDVLVIRLFVRLIAENYK